MRVADFTNDQFRLDGKVAIVTGAGGRGNSIGRAYAVGVANAGASVVVADLNKEGAERVAAASRKTLDSALQAGGSSLRNYVQANGELGYFQHQFSVYGREGEPCPNCDCEQTVKRIVQSGRSTFYCARRQR